MPAREVLRGRGQRSVSVTSFAACAVCFSLRAMFRVCHDLFSVFGFGFSFLCESRVGVVVVDAMGPYFDSLSVVQASPVSGRDSGLAG